MSESYGYATIVPRVGVLTQAYAAGAMFLISLQSFYVPSLGAAIFCYIGLVMLVPLMRSRPPPSLVLFTLATIIGGFLTAFFAGNGDAELKSALGMAISASGMIIAYSAFGDRPRLLLVCLQVVLALHAGVLLLQALYYFASGEYFDVFVQLGIGEQTVYSRKGFELGGVRVPRFAGLFNEPGTYSTIMLPILAAEYAVSRRLSWITAMVLASVLLTMSLGGIAVAFAFVAVVGTHQFITQPRRRPIILLGLVAAAGALGWWFLDNLAAREELYVGSVTDHEAMGWAFSSDAVTIFGHSLNQIPGFYSVGYFGAWLDFYIVSGAYGVGVLLAFLATMSSLSIGVSAIILLSKAKLTYPLLFALIAAAKIAQQEQKRRSTWPPNRYSRSHFP